MAGKAKFDQEAAFKSIIGAGATEDEKKADKPAGKGRLRSFTENCLCESSERK